MMRQWKNGSQSADLMLDISLGRTNYQKIRKYGLIEGLATGSKKVLWDGPADYTFQLSAGPHQISSSNAGDNVPMLIQGLDENYNPREIKVNLNGQTPVDIGDFLRTYRALNVTQSGTNLLGDVYVYEATPVTGGVPNDLTKVKAFVSSEFQQTQMCVFTTQSGKITALQYQIQGIKRQATGIKGFVDVREPNGVWLVKEPFGFSTDGSNMAKSLDHLWLIVPEKSDIRIRVETLDQSNVDLTGRIDLISENINE